MPTRPQDESIVEWPGLPACAVTSSNTTASARGKPCRTAEHGDSKQSDDQPKCVS